MNRIYYALWYCLDHRNRYLIWYPNDSDGVVVSQEGQIPVFATNSDLHAYAQAHEISLVLEEPKLHNLDRVIQDLGRKKPVQINCQEMLDAWNMLGDVSNSVDSRFDEDKALTQKIYNKLFWGSNIPAVTPEGRSYEPLWSRGEHLIMRQVLGEGFAMLRRHVQPNG